MTLPSSETITIQLTVSSVVPLPCPPDRVIVPRPNGYHFGLPKLKRQTQETNPGADEYLGLAKPLAAAFPCKHKARLYWASCEGAAWAPRPQSEPSATTHSGSPRPLFLLCSAASISNISMEISFNSCSGSSRRSWLNTHFCLNVGPK